MRVGAALVAARRLLIATASLVVEQALLARGLSCCAARGIFLDQGSNSVPCVGSQILYFRATNVFQSLEDPVIAFL